VATSDHTSPASNDGNEQLRFAASLLIDRAAAAVSAPDERWTVDRDHEGRLILGTYAPDDVLDGVPMTSVAATFAYQDDPEGATYEGAFALAAHVAALDPAVGRMLGHLLEAIADGHGIEGTARQLADVYLNGPAGAR